MTVLVAMGWALWGVAAAGLVGKRLGRGLAQARAFEAVLRSSSDVPTAHELRLLLNGGDWRDPIERHHDSIRELTQGASLAVTAGMLWWLATVA